MDEKYLFQRLRYWARRLELRSWKIRVRFEDEIREKRCEYRAMTIPNYRRKRAVIIFARKYLRSKKAMNELALHELCHLCDEGAKDVHLIINLLVKLARREV